MIRAPWGTGIEAVNRPPRTDPPTKVAPVDWNATTGALEGATDPEHVDAGPLREE